MQKNSTGKKMRVKVIRLSTRGTGARDPIPALCSYEKEEDETASRYNTEIEKNPSANFAGGITIFVDEFTKAGDTIEIRAGRDLLWVMHANLIIEDAINSACSEMALAQSLGCSDNHPGS